MAGQLKPSFAVGMECGSVGDCRREEGLSFPEATSPVRVNSREDHLMSRSLQVCMGATMQCSFGMAPSSLVVLPTNKVFTDQMPAANIMDHIPLTNIMPFGMCQSLANPAVAAATAAALGVLTPMPCLPVTSAPWVPGAPTVLLGNFPALDNESQLMCMWGGVIKLTNAGEETVEVP